MSGANPFGPGRGAAPVAATNANWIANAQRSNKAPIPNLANACLGLRLDPDFAGMLAFDEMLQAPVMHWVVPGAVRNGNASPRPVTDLDVSDIQESLQLKGLRRLGEATARAAIHVVANEHPFHPLRERLDGLAWDGEPRLTEWVIKYLGAKDNEYHRQVGFRWMIAMVARVFRPGCKCDHMLVLEGPQGALKSQVIAALAGDYYSDTMPDLGGDPIRLSMHLRGKWLIEVSELSAFSKAETSRLKAFITTQVEQYTPKFGHREVREPRQCLFVGTTNDDQFLKDETGNRRYWPVKCGVIKLAEFRALVDQLLAEAVEEFRKGTPWWIEAKVEEEFFKPEQAKRLWVDAWEPKVRAYLKGKWRVVLMEVAEDGLGFIPSRFGTGEQRRLAAVMRACEWELKRSTNARYWEPTQTVP